MNYEERIWKSRILPFFIKIIMSENQKETREVQENFQFIMQGTSASGKLSKVDFQKCEFKHFSAIDNSHLKSESLTKIK